MFKVEPNEVEKVKSGIVLTLDANMADLIESLLGNHSALRRGVLDDEVRALYYALERVRMKQGRNRVTARAVSATPEHMMTTWKVEDAAG